MLLLLRLLRRSAQILHELAQVRARTRPERQAKRVKETIINATRATIMMASARRRRRRRFQFDCRMNVPLIVFVFECFCVRSHTHLSIIHIGGSRCLLGGRDHNPYTHGALYLCVIFDTGALFVGCV